MAARTDYTHIHKTPDQVLEAAEAISRQAPREFRRSVYLYYMTRYWVSVHEARNHEIPIQVWNEYHNALDHFNRLLTQPGTSVEDKVAVDHHNLPRMENHILRALLDIMKLFCVRVGDQFDTLLMQYEAEALSLVDQGRFKRNYLKMNREAEARLEHAKTTDHQLSQGDVGEDVVIRNYLAACFAYDELVSYIQDKVDDIAVAEDQFGNIRRKRKIKDIVTDFKVNIFGGLIVILISGLISHFF